MAAAALLATFARVGGALLGRAAGPREGARELGRGSPAGPRQRGGR